MADNDNYTGSTIFNDPEKLKRTKQNLADDFATGTDYGEKLKGYLGLSDQPDQADIQSKRNQLARQMVYRNK